MIGAQSSSALPLRCSGGSIPPLRRLRCRRPARAGGLRLARLGPVGVVTGERRFDRGPDGRPGQLARAPTALDARHGDPGPGGTRGRIPARANAPAPRPDEQQPRHQGAGEERACAQHPDLTEEPAHRRPPYGAGGAVGTGAVGALPVAAVCTGREGRSTCTRRTPGTDATAPVASCSAPSGTWVSQASRPATVTATPVSPAPASAASARVRRSSAIRCPGQTSANPANTAGTTTNATTNHRARWAMHPPILRPGTAAPCAHSPDSDGHALSGKRWHDLPAMDQPQRGPTGGEHGPRTPGEPHSETNADLCRRGSGVSRCGPPRRW